MPIEKVRFGIPKLDAMLGGSEEDSGILTVSADGRTHVASVCIAGPDGTGKSVLALHMAARYAADAYRDVQGQLSADQQEKLLPTLPRVIYASTDLQLEKAERVFYNFMLDFPLAKPEVFSKAWFEEGTSIADERANCQVDFVALLPGSRELAKYVCEGSSAPSVAFLDLARHTAGDDWLFLNRLLASLERQENTPPHLVIVDAVEGLEAFSGEVDTFGAVQTRRSRVAQLMRVAGTKTHMALVVEEADPTVRLPEDYIADVVLRLRSVNATSGPQSYVRRTIEIEKARAQVHTRGQHLLTFRQGKGTLTGKRFNPDDPALVVQFKAGKPFKVVPFRLAEKELEGLPQGIRQREDTLSRVAYVHILPSLDSRSRQAVPKASTPDNELERYKLGFGIHYLDDVLTKSDDNQVGDWKGLTCGDMTALIGEHGTHRNRLANAFLSRCFKQGRNDVAVLVTTRNTNADELAKELQAHDVPHEHKPLKVDPNRIVCRKLEVHDLTPSVLLHIVESSVRDAQRILGNRRKALVRLVLSDLEQMRNTYPGVVDDPLFLPALRQWMSSQKVTSIVVHTDAAGPNRSRQSVLTQMLYAAARHSIYTWLVPFFGELRSAIAAIPQLHDDTRPVVRELKGAKTRDGDPEQRLIVDPHFEMYKGILEQQPLHLVPLQIRLWGKGPEYDVYANSLISRYANVFGEEATRNVFVRSSQDVSYEDLRSANYFRGDMRLDETVVVQVDEFWHSHHNELADMEKYLFSLTGRGLNRHPQSDTRIEERSEDDPYRVFQFTGQTTGNEELIMERVKEKKYLEDSKAEDRAYENLSWPDKESALRVDFFASVKLGYNYYRARKIHKIDRVPYFWDFGFLLLRKSLWDAAAKKSFRTDYTLGDKSVMVGQVWNSMIMPEALPIIPSTDGSTEHQDASNTVNRPAHLEPLYPEKMEATVKERFLKGPKPPSWRVFLHACAVIQRTAGAERDGHVVAFDLDIVAPESLSCLVLEVWGSTIADSFSGGGEFDSEGFFLNEDDPKTPPTFARRRSDKAGKSLDQLLEDQQNMKAFYLTWLLLGETMTAKQFDIGWFEPPGRRAQPTAVAARHWYASASILQPECAPDDPLIPARNPGHFSVRGDWFLGIASGSRSRLLGERAIDILSTRKSNLERLKGGIGLPTRDLGDVETTDNAPTRLTVLDSENRKRPLTYGEVLRLGCSDIEAAENLASPQQRFYWLWRYSIADYHRQAPVFSLMVASLLKKTPHYWDKLINDDFWRREQKPTRPRPRTGFEAFDHLIKMQPDELERLASYKEFKRDFPKTPKPQYIL